MFRVRLLAGASIQGPHGALTGAVLQRHRLALLALLSTAPARTLSRDKLIAYLWPESDASRGRHLLRSAVHVLRQALGEDALSSPGDDLRLNPATISSDVAEFQECIDGRNFERAVAHYAGPFMDGFHLNDAPEFERWLDSERARLARSFCDALEQLARSAEQSGNTTNAVSSWRRLAIADPPNSRVALALMRAPEAAGDRAGAIRHARVHEQLLREELGAEPDPDIAAFAERLRQSPVAQPRNDAPALLEESADPAILSPHSHCKSCRRRKFRCFPVRPHFRRVSGAVRLPLRQRSRSRQYRSARISSCARKMMPPSPSRPRDR